jgi:bacterioferritin-associated ferredoxin
MLSAKSIVLMSAIIRVSVELARHVAIGRECGKCRGATMSEKR